MVLLLLADLWHFLNCCLYFDCVFFTSSVLMLVSKWQGYPSVFQCSDIFLFAHKKKYSIPSLAAQKLSMDRCLCCKHFRVNNVIQKYHDIQQDTGQCGQSLRAPQFWKWNPTLSVYSPELSWTENICNIVSYCQYTQGQPESGVRGDECEAS